MNNSWQTLTDAATAAGWDAATRLLVAAGFLGGPEPAAAVDAAHAFAAAAGLTADELVGALAATVDARNRGGAFAAYLGELTRAAAPAAAADVREAVLVLTADEKAAVRALLAGPPGDGWAAGPLLFTKSAAAGELTVHLHVVGGPNGAYLDVFVNHGRHLAATHPPVAELRDLYAVQVDGRPFGIRLP